VITRRISARACSVTSLLASPVSADVCLAAVLAGSSAVQPATGLVTHVCSHIDDVRSNRTGLCRTARISGDKEAFNLAASPQRDGKKSLRPTAKTEHAGHRTSHPRPLRAGSTNTMHPLRDADRSSPSTKSAKVVLGIIY
jgi:hypothetical protein